MSQNRRLDMQVQTSRIHDDLIVIDRKYGSNTIKSSLTHVSSSTLVHQFRKQCFHLVTDLNSSVVDPPVETGSNIQISFFVREKSENGRILYVSKAFEHVRKA